MRPPVAEREAAHRPEPPHTRDDLIFDGELFKIGRFDSPVDAPDFATAGPIVGPVFVFPRTSVWIHHEGGRRFVGDVHSVAFYNTGQRYRREAIAPAGDICDWFRVRGDVALEAVNALGEHVEDPHAPFRRERLKAPARVCLVERALFHQLRTSVRHDALHVEETALAMLFRLLLDANDAQPHARSRSGTQLSEAARAVLGSSLTRNTSLASIASAVGCSPFHLCRTFRGETGTTLNAYRDRLRLALAFDLVLDCGADLTQAALRAGYSSHSHFTWAFRRTFDITPSEVRALTRESRRDLRDTIARLLRTGPPG